ncbi:hypothetical protein BDW62DRAFT_202876 [Aspergillus aurantiobrunneus]
MAKATPSPWPTVLGLFYFLAVLLGVTLGEPSPRATPGQPLPRIDNNIEPCSPDCASCTAGEPPDTEKSARKREEEDKSLAKRVLGNPWEPAWRGSTENYLIDQFPKARWAQMEPTDGVSHSTSIFEKLLDQSFKTALGTLKGCVVVVVVSRKGFYMSHHWEMWSFSQAKWVPGDQKLFQERVLDELRYGAGKDMKSLTRYMRENGPFASEYQPKAYVFMRRSMGNPDYDFFYRTKVYQLAGTVTQITGLATSVVTYENVHGHDPYNAVLGKLFFEYDPEGLGEGCELALSRLWVESDLVYHDEWTPLESQVSRGDNVMNEDSHDETDDSDDEMDDSDDEMDDSDDEIDEDSDHQGTGTPTPSW